MNFEVQRKRNGFYILAALDCEARAMAESNGWQNPTRLPFADCADPAKVIHFAQGMVGWQNLLPIVGNAGRVWHGECRCGKCH